MLEISIPKDIREYEAKLVGPLSTRKVVCVLFMCACTYSVYALQKYILRMEPPSGIPCFIAAMPGFLLGWIKPYGLKMEVFLKTAFICNYISPKIRKYKMINLEEQIKKDKQKERARIEKQTMKNMSKIELKEYQKKKKNESKEKLKAQKKNQNNKKKKEEGFK